MKLRHALLALSVLVAFPLIMLACLGPGPDSDSLGTSLDPLSGGADASRFDAGGGHGDGGGHADGGICHATILPDHELFITDLSVVKDSRTAKDGPWSFQHLIEGMTPVGTTPSQFVLTWLQQWENVTSTNGFAVDPRPTIVPDVINAWPKKVDGSLDLSKAPLRLLAIVSRLDLRTSCTDTGEGRFVWEFLQANGQPFQPSFTVIFEYHLPPPLTVHQWAQEWHNLGSLPFGPTYNAALQAVTDKFTNANAFPGRVNGSALDQLRTNEIVLDGFWELREFTLQAQADAGTGSGLLLESFTKQSPDQSFNVGDGGVELAAILEKHRNAVIAGKFIQPTPILGGISPETFTWRPPLKALPDGGADETLRHAFAQQTCNGCHYAETGTTFLQVSGGFGLPDGGFSPAILSNFITGNQLPFRETDLKRLICNTTCVGTSPATDPILEPDFTPGVLE